MRIPELKYSADFELLPGSAAEIDIRLAIIFLNAEEPEQIFAQLRIDKKTSELVSRLIKYARTDILDRPSVKPCLIKSAKTRLNVCSY